MNFILKTSCSDEFYDGHEYALVRISRDTAAAIMATKRLFELAKQRSPELMSMVFYSTGAEYFSAYADEFIELLEGFDMPDNPGFIQAPEDFCISGVERSDGDRLVVTEGNIYWICEAGDIRIETACLPYSEVARAAIEVQEVQKA